MNSQKLLSQLQILQLPEIETQRYLLKRKGNIYEYRFINFFPGTIKDSPSDILNQKIFRSKNFNKKKNQSKIVVSKKESRFEGLMSSLISQQTNGINHGREQIDKQKNNKYNSVQKNNHSKSIYRNFSIQKINVPQKIIRDEQSCQILQSINEDLGQKKENIKDKKDELFQRIKEFSSIRNKLSKLVINLDCTLAQKINETRDINENLQKIIQKEQRHIQSLKDKINKAEKQYELMSKYKEQHLQFKKS